MFKLVTIKDTVLVPAHLFGVSRLKALEHMVNKRYSDRVIAEHGLCIALWDFLKVGEDRLVVQSGEASTVCIFRLVVFCPFPGEVIFGRISGSHEKGLVVEVGFFEGVHVDTAGLPKPSNFDEKERVWIWKPEQEEDGGADAAQALYMDVTNECVLRVERCEYENRRKIKPSEREKEGVGNAMSIEGAIYDEVTGDNQGLGDPLWWFEGEEEGEEVGEEEDGEAGAAGEAGEEGEGGEGYDGEAYGEYEAEVGEEEQVEALPYDNEGEGDEEQEEGCGMVDGDDDV